MSERPKDTPTNPPLIRPAGGPGAVAPVKKKIPGGEFTEAEDTAVLAPSLAAAFLNCGVDRLHRGEASAAIGDFAEAIKIDPTLARAWCLRGYAYAISLDFTRSLADLRKALELGLSGNHEDNAWLRLWVVRARIGDVVLATKDLNGHFSKRVDPPPAQWVRRIAAFLGGSVPEKEFLADIEGEVIAASAERSCEAWYFAGQKRLVAGDRLGAKSAFERSVGAGAKAISAWSGSRAELLSFHTAKK
ncbi:MAG: tetratricopeptide repeat protein [Planctomycetota bacterium]